jgi:replicative DNA helicase
MSATVPNMTGFDATMPASYDAERTILGAILLDPERVLEIAAILHADDFSLDSHRRIFLRMVETFQEFESVDIVTLAETLNQHKETESVGGVAYLCSLTDGLPRRPVIDDYLKIVKDKALARRILRICTDLTARAYSQDEPALAIATRGIHEISAMVEGCQTKPDVFGAEEMATDSEFRLLDNPVETTSIATGITKLDEQTGGGIRLGELWVIGASPSRGKTTLARQIVKGAIMRGVSAYVHSGEMTKESWVDVTACLIADMPAWKILEPGLLSPHEKEQVLRPALRELAKLPLRVSDSGGIHLDKLMWIATREKRQRDIKLFVVDYAQIIQAPGRDPREQVTNVAQRLRLFAKAENVATVLLSQSPRPEGRNINARPTMFSLKESGALEEAAHTVILPYRPVEPETSVFTGEDELIIGKQRWGSIGSIPVNLNGKLLKFEAR